MKSIALTNNFLYALGTSAKGPSYIIKYHWKPDSKDKHLSYDSSEIVHNRAASVMGINKQGT